MLGPLGSRRLVFALGSVSVRVHLSRLSRICLFWECSPHRGLMLPRQQEDKTARCSPPPPPPVLAGLGELPRVLASWEPPVPPTHCSSPGDVVLTLIPPPPVANLGSCAPPASAPGAAGGQLGADARAATSKIPRVQPSMLKGALNFKYPASISLLRAFCLAFRQPFGRGLARPSGAASEALCPGAVLTRLPRLLVLSQQSTEAVLAGSCHPRGLPQRSQGKGSLKRDILVSVALLCHGFPLLARSERSFNFSSCNSLCTGVQHPRASVQPKQMLLFRALRMCSRFSSRSKGKKNIPPALTPSSKSWALKARGLSLGPCLHHLPL